MDNCFMTRSVLRQCMMRGLFPAVALLSAMATSAQPEHALPLVMSATNLDRQGFVRVVNHSYRSGSVQIHAVDDSGERFGPVSLSLNPRAAAHFSSRDLERGNASKGLSAGVGDGEGDWRLELDSVLDIEALAYVRTGDGFVTSIHQVVEQIVEEEGLLRYAVPIFNPASNQSQRSRLRLINTGNQDARIRITGLDDGGNSGQGGAVRLALPAGTARTLSAQQLERGGGTDFTGRLGDGEGKWRLFVVSDRPIAIMNLLSSPDGKLSNLSKGAPAGNLALPLVISASHPFQQGFVRIINRSDVPGSVHIHAIDDTGRRFGPISLSLNPKAAAHFNSTDLERGNASKGLSEGVGDGEGDWRLELDSVLDIEALAYVRTRDGFVTGVHQVAEQEAFRRWRVPFFNPGSNLSQRSRLRVINPGSHDASITITGLDDLGETPSGEKVRLTLLAGATRTLSSQQIEQGDDSIDGSLGDGAGKWRLSVSSNRPIRVMSLLQSPAGNLANLSSSSATFARSYHGKVTGVVGSFDEVDVILTSRGTLRTMHPDSAGRFAFHDLEAGEYVIKVRAEGYTASPARTVRIPVSGDDEPFRLNPVSANTFVFHWEEDQSTAGYDYTTHVNEAPRIEFLGEPIDILDDSSAERLRRDYNILLVDSEGGAWSQEHAYRLLDTMKRVPQESRDAYTAQMLPPSRWLLTSEYTEHDIDITRHDNGNRSVVVSQAAFVNASPRVATVDGKRGIWFSRRLHHAVVRYVTDNGRNETAYERILRDRFGLTTRVDDYHALTAPTGHETAARFQPFHAEEIVQIINMLEEMPAGMHKLPGFRYLVRRLDGTPHPLYPVAPAVAWPDHGYVEFMDKAFLSTSVQHLHRLILHEKAHFLWAHLFDDRLKEDWIELGGWYRDASSPSGWFTTKTAEFVSAYAHLSNPNEDMAETIAYFIANPDRLKSRAISKYEFVRDRIMQGNIYLSRIREDLTFEVYNLFPDYVFPGKIRRVDITVEGAPESDKTIDIEIELHALDNVLEGAQWARTRILSEVGTFFDIYLYPVDESGEHIDRGVVLRGRHTLSEYAKAGYWLPEQFNIRDAAGNERFQRTSDFGWKLYVDNPLEDYRPPRYVAGTAALSRSRSTVENREVQVIRATWRVEEDNPMLHPGGCYASMNDEISDTYRIEEYGNHNSLDRLCIVDFVMPDYMPSSVYSLVYVAMWDVARNEQDVYFTGDFSHGEQNEEAQRIELVTVNPDTEPPEVAINRIEIDAEPVNPKAPNGETVVTIRFRIRDDISGYTHGSLNLRDPQGVEHFAYFYAEDRDWLFARHDPTRWKLHTFTHILPPGSAPGTWGLADMTIYDRARNFRQYDFTEIIHFEVER